MGKGNRNRAARAAFKAGKSVTKAPTPPARLKVFLDDLRSVRQVFPSDLDGWTICRNPHEFYKLINSTPISQIAYIAFDHDLGVGWRENGHTCATWVEEKLHEQRPETLPDMSCHSDNPSGARNIRLAIRAMEEWHEKMLRGEA
jgi:hypothetical protein